jgi:hypothetical protein
VANTLNLFRDGGGWLHRFVRCSHRSYGRGAGVGRGLGVGVHLPVHGVGVGVGFGVAVGVAVVVAVGVGVGVGVAVDVGVAVGVGVGVGAPNCAQYLPPVLKGPNPPQMIISLPVHTAVCSSRISGTLVTLVAIQLSMPGSYLPPVLRERPAKPTPPQTIISLPVQTAVW